MAIVPKLWRGGRRRKRHDALGLDAALTAVSVAYELPFLDNYLSLKEMIWLKLRQNVQSVLLCHITFGTAGS